MPAVSIARTWAQNDTQELWLMLHYLRNPQIRVLSGDPDASAQDKVFERRGLWTKL